MNAIVEVATARGVARVGPVLVWVTNADDTVAPMERVAISALRVVSISGHSISAVSPDHIFYGEELAVA